MKKTGSWIVLILALLWVLALVCLQLHAEPAMPRPNSLGVDQIYENHNAYLFAVPISGAVMDGATSISFQPYNTMELYTEQVLFCGDVTKKFEGKTGPMVVTYDRVAHKMFRGVACHALVSVFEVHDDQIEVKP